MMPTKIDSILCDQQELLFFKATSVHYGDKIAELKTELSQTKIIRDREIDALRAQLNALENAKEKEVTRKWEHQCKRTFQINDRLYDQLKVLKKYQESEGPRLKTLLWESRENERKLRAEVEQLRRIAESRESRLAKQREEYDTLRQRREADCDEYNEQLEICKTARFSSIEEGANMRARNNIKALIDAKDNIAKELQSSLNAKDEAMKELQSSSNAKDEAMKKLQSSSNAKDEAMNKLQDDLAMQSKEIGDLRRQIQVCDGMKRSMTATTDKISKDGEMEDIHEETLQQAKADLRRQKTEFAKMEVSVRRDRKAFKQRTMAYERTEAATKKKIDDATLRINCLQKEIAALDGEVKKLREAGSAENTRAHDAQQKVRELENTIDERNTQIRKANEDIEKLRDNLTESQTGTRNAQEQIQRLQETVAQHETDQGNARVQAAGLQETLDQTRKQVNDLNAEVQKLNGIAEQGNARANQATEEAQRMVQRATAEHVLQAKAATEEVSRLEHLLRDQISKAENAAQQVGMLHQQVTDLSKKSREAQDSVDDCKLELSFLYSELADAQQEIEDSKGTIADLEKKAAQPSISHQQAVGPKPLDFFDASPLQNDNEVSANVQRLERDLGEARELLSELGEDIMDEETRDLLAALVLNNGYLVDLEKHMQDNYFATVDELKDLIKGAGISDADIEAIDLNPMYYNKVLVRQAKETRWVLSQVRQLLEESDPDYGYIMHVLRSTRSEGPTVPYATAMNPPYYLNNNNNNSSSNNNTLSTPTSPLLPSYLAPVPSTSALYAPIFLPGLNVSATDAEYDPHLPQAGLSMLPFPPMPPNADEEHSNPFVRPIGERKIRIPRSRRP